MGKIICLYGLPACGKTTQAEKIRAEFSYVQFGMGDRLRDEIASGSNLGQEIKIFVDSGKLIPDELMEQIIKNVGEKIKDNGIIFDGFPRMMSQILMLEKISQELDREINKCFYLKVKPETAIARIEARAATSGRGDDKDIEAIKNRLDTFNRESKVILDYYGQHNKLVEIDGELSIEEVYQEIKKHLL